MTPSYSKSYLGPLNKLVQFNNIDQYSIDKNHIDPDYSALSEEVEMNPK